MRTLRRLFPQAALLLLLGALALTLGAASGEPTLDLTLRARGMAFYLDGVAEPNPPLVLPANRTVRLTFVNEDRGVDHNLRLAGIGAREAGIESDVLPGDGSTQRLRFRTPDEATIASYSCSLHLAMMTARLEVR